jgi:hypothetical protein
LERPWLVTTIRAWPASAVPEADTPGASNETECQASGSLASGDVLKHRLDEVE